MSSPKQAPSMADAGSGPSKQQEPKQREETETETGGHTKKISPRQDEDTMIHKFAAGLVAYHVLAFVCLFGPSRDLFWLGGWWAFLLPLLSHTAIAVYEARCVPSQIAEQWAGLDWRRDDVHMWDKLNTIAFMGVCPMLAFLTAGLCHRTQTGHMHLFELFYSTAKLFALVGWGLALSAVYTNDYVTTAVRVQKDRGQRVISTGPYQYIRHPGYLGMALYSLALPFLVDCSYVIGWSAILLSLLVVRTAREDDLLTKELPGYDDYVKRVPYRMLINYW